MDFNTVCGLLGIACGKFKKNAISAARCGAD